MLLTAVVVALKLAVVAPAATVADAGRVNSALLLESATRAPPAGAGLVRVTVQVLVAFGPKLAGAHVNNDTSAAGAMVRVRLALPVPALLVALSVTVDVPAAVGVPEIKPVVVLTDKPTGSPVAP